jgi:hypothetical protein
MKNLVLGALLAVASSTGCIISSGSSDSVVTARWQFTHLADKSPRSCPVGFATATIVSQATDPITHLGAGLTVVDKFNCSDLQGTISLPDDTYLVWVQIESDDGNQIYTKSAQTFVDTSFGDATIDIDILDDGGYFFMTWDLVAAQTQKPLTCSEAGVTSSGSVEAISTSMANSQKIITDKFTCEDHFGTTDALLAGSYTVSIDALNSSDLALSNPTVVTNKQITAPDGLTDLGHIVIPIR